MAAIATYLPESQIITLSENFSALDDPDNPIGFTTPEQLGFFFHEWIHLLHNISSISGLAIFSTQLLLWSNFRWAMDESGLSGGSQSMDQKSISGNKNLLKYFSSNRYKNSSEIPSRATPEQIKFVSANLADMEIEDEHIINSSLIKCKFETSNTIYDVDIGLFEILESAAFMLECKIVTEMNGTIFGSPFNPYHLVKALANGISSSLDDRIIICCMLASLQSNDPPRVLLTILEMVGSIKDSERYDTLTNLVKTQLIDQKKSTDQTLEQIRLLFPIEEPMAEFVKMTLNRIERNLEYRLEDPFFEFSIIEKVAQDNKNLDVYISKFGACSIIQKRHGNDDLIERDIMYDFSIQDFSENASFGLKMIRSAFHFISIHYSPTGSIDTTSNKLSKCPFYTTCGSTLRKNNSEICAKTPWQAKLFEENESCYYSAAIRATNPPNAPLL